MPLEFSLEGEVEEIQGLLRRDVSVEPLPDLVRLEEGRHAVVEPGEDLVTLPGDDGVAVDRLPSRPPPHGVQSGQVHERLVAARSEHQVRLLLSSLPEPLVEALTDEHAPPSIQAGTVEATGSHGLQATVVCGETVRGWARPRVGWRYEAPHHGLQQQLLSSPIEHRGVEAGGDVRRGLVLTTTRSIAPGWDGTAVLSSSSSHQASTLADQPLPPQGQGCPPTH